MSRATRAWPTLVCALTAVACAAGAAAGWYHYRLPRRFAAVVDGRLYRSGTLLPGQMARLRDDYGIGRVVSLLDSNAPITKAERAAARRLGIEWHNVPLTGDGASTPADRVRILELLTDPNAPATLVHCAAGVNRTGLAVGLYRLRQQGWTLEQVLSEMKQFGFADRPQHENLRQALLEQASATSNKVASQR